MRKNISISKAMPQSRIGAHTHLVGELQFAKTLLICGRFSGRIRGGEVLIVDKGAYVEADIEVETLIARGHLQGRITARTSIIIEESGVVNADINTKDIRIAAHAQYQGRCVTSGRK